MTAPESPLVLRDPEAHAKLDEILEWIKGDPLKDTSGAAERLRNHEATLVDHGARLERHSARIRAIEEQGGERAKSTIHALIDKALTLLTMVLSGAIGGAIAAKFFHR